MRHRESLTPEQERDLDALDRALAGEPVELELRELEELVRDVRATGPEMTPAFAARLEQEVADGFPSSQERPPLSVRRPWAGRRWVLLPAAGSLAAVLVALVVVLGGGTGSQGLSAGGGGDSAATEAAVPADPGAGVAADSATGSKAAPAAPDEAAKAQAQRSAAPAPAQSSGGGSGSAGGSPLSIAPAPARKVERNAVLVIETPDGKFESTTDAVIATVGRFRGIVASSQIGSSDANGGEATFELRIPTERLDQALAALSKLGHVTERNQNLQDITGSFQSAQERLTDARAERRGLLRALARATTQTQIASIKAQLRSVSSRISGLKGQLAALRRRADLSTVNMTVRGGGSSETGGGGGGAVDARRRGRRRAAGARGQRRRRAHLPGGARTARADRRRDRARRAQRTAAPARDGARSSLTDGRGSRGPTPARAARQARRTRVVCYCSHDADARRRGDRASDERPGLRNPRPEGARPGRRRHRPAHVRRRPRHLPRGRRERHVLHRAPAVTPARSASTATAAR